MDQSCLHWYMWVSPAEATHRPPRYPRNREQHQGPGTSPGEPLVPGRLWSGRDSPESAEHRSLRGAELPSRLALHRHL